MRSGRWSSSSGRWSSIPKYALPPCKIEIKREILSEYHVKVDHLFTISIGNIKKLVPNFFDEGKDVL